MAFYFWRCRNLEPPLCLAQWGKRGGSGLLLFTGKYTTIFCSCNYFFSLFSDGQYHVSIKVPILHVLDLVCFMDFVDFQTILNAWWYDFPILCLAIEFCCIFVAYERKDYTIVFVFADGRCC